MRRSFFMGDVYTFQQATARWEGNISLPGSKSITNRALMLAAVADGTSVLRQVLLADDTWRMMDGLRALGVSLRVSEGNHTVEVDGCGGSWPATDAVIDCGNSGTTLRFLLAMGCVSGGEYVLDGIARMRERPIGDEVDALRQLGAKIEYLGVEGYPPLRVHPSRMTGGMVEVDSPASSQMVSALLMAAPMAANDVMIAAVGDVPSIPYLRITEAVMEAFGVAVLSNYVGNEARFVVEVPQRYRACDYVIEPDASNASYFLAAAAVTGSSVVIEGLGTESMQGDVGFVDVLAQMGCRVEKSSRRLAVAGPQGGHKLKAVDVNLNAMPDMVQTLACVALFADGVTTIRDVGNLRVKETDRLAALEAELTKLGARVTVTGDDIAIEPPEHIAPVAIETYDDHRMAMSFAVVGLRCPGLTILNPDCCRKTFPDFFDRFSVMAGIAPSA